MNLEVLDKSFIEKAQSASKQFETRFVSEMLKSAGFDSIYKTFSGGVGEEQFSSFLRDQHAKAIVEAGGFGLAEKFFEQMVKMEVKNNEDQK